MKPEIAKHEELFTAEQETGYPLRFAWALLPTTCDREGRFKWRPGAMKTDVLPFDDLDFANVLDEFVRRGFLVKYRHGCEWYGLIPTFGKHQFVNNREAASDLPGPDGADEVIARHSNGLDVLGTREARVGHAGQGERKGREGNGKGRSDSPEPLRDSGHATTSPTVLEFPTIGADGTVWRLREAQVVEWERLFPTIDVRQESRQALAWVLANPGRRKTGRGMPSFLVGWFSRSANRGWRAHPPARAAGSYRPSTGPAWACPHADGCGSMSVCARNLELDPTGQRFAFRPGALFVRDAHGVPREAVAV